MPGVQRAPMPAAAAAGCRDDADARSTAPRSPGRALDGSTADAAAGRAARPRSCCRDRRRRGECHARPRRPRRARRRRARRPASTSTRWCSAPTRAARRWRSARGGKLPTSVHAGRRRRPAAQPTVKVTSKGSTKIELQVTGRPQGHAVLAGARREQQRRVGGEGRRLRHRWLDPGRRLRQRLAGASAVGLVLGDAHVDAAAEGVDRDRGLGARAARCASCSRCAAARRRSTTRRTTTDDVLPAIANPLVAAGERPRALAVVVGALAVGIVGAAGVALVGGVGRGRAGRAGRVRAAHALPRVAGRAARARGRRAVRGRAAAPARLRRPTSTGPAAVHAR